MISDIYLKNLKGMFGVIDLAAVANRTRAAAEEKAARFGVERVMTIDEVAAAPDIELVVNLTPAFAHYGVVRRMLLAGKHVWTEKTLGVTVDEARDLAALAGERGLWLGVAPDTVLGAGIQTARHALDAGEIGAVTSGLAVINRDQNLNSETFTFLRGPGGALPYDVGVYYVGALLALLGPVRSIRAFGAPAPRHAPQGPGGEGWQIPGCNVVSAALRFECGALVSVLFDGNTVAAEQHRLALFGTRGILELGDPNTFDGPVTMVRADGSRRQMPFTHGYDGRNRLDPAPFDFYGHRGVGVAEMAHAILAGRQNRCSGGYGLHCVEVLAGMEESAATGRTVEPASRFEMPPLAPGHLGDPADAERSLAD